MKNLLVLIFAGVSLAGCSALKDYNNSYKGSSAQAEQTASSSSSRHRQVNHEDLNAQHNKKTRVGLVVDKIIYFALDKSTVSDIARDRMRDLLSDLRQARFIKLGGHASTEGSNEYNFALAEKRARTVANFLRASGVKSKIRIVSYGEEKLKSTTNQALNRRVEIISR